MKRIKVILLLGLLGQASLATADVAVGMGTPGFYGVIELGNAPMPQVVYPQPILVQPLAFGTPLPPPAYLRVPPGYARHWRWHCHEFNACGRPVYFVREGWYRHVYAPLYDHRGEGRNEFRGRGEGHDEGFRRE